MSGKWLGSFRSRTRSEYMALYGLSRIASVCPIPRQEDFGIRDLVCVLTSERGKAVYPESAFYVQVKSNLDAFEFDDDAVNWISKHMDQPLFICAADKNTETLRLYSCSPIWAALLRRDDPLTIKVRLGGVVNPQPKINVEPGGKVIFEVPLGPPIIEQQIADLEADSSLAYAILKAWILLDTANIARRRLGPIAATMCLQHQTNVVPPQPYTHVYAYGNPTAGLWWKTRSFQY